MFARPEYTRVRQQSHVISDTELALLPPQVSQDGLRQMRVGSSRDRNVVVQCPDTKTLPVRERIRHTAGLIKSWRWQRSWIYTGLIDGQQNGTNGEPHHRGWRKTVGGAVALTGVVFLMNLSITIALMAKFGATDGVGLLYYGECGVVKRWNTILHLLINVLSTLLLGASNYAMQCLSSPSRTEVDAAHAKGITLDIGVLSVRNFFYMRPTKGILWLFLCLSTLPLSFLWNSTIFTTGAVNSSSYLIVDDGFLSGSPYQQPLQTSSGCGDYTQLDPQRVVGFMYDGYQSGRYLNMSAGDCFTTYLNGDGSRFRNLILITKPETTMNMSRCGYRSQQWKNSSIVAIHNQLTQGPLWPLQSMNITLFPYDRHPDNLTTNITQELDRSGIWHFGPYPINRCLAEEYAAPCKLQFASFILYIVVVCNFVKLVCLSTTFLYLWDPKEPILATIGDAVSSFLDNRDETTIGLCLLDHFHLDKPTLTSGQKPRHDDCHNQSVFWKNRKRKARIPLEYERKPSTLLHTAESRRRQGTLTLLGLMFWFSGFMAVILSTLPQGVTMFSMRFGAVSSNALLGVHGDSGFGLFVDIVIANSCQVFFSAIYVFYNSTLTARWGALEWASFAQPKLKSLRVTWPRGRQRSTYFLQLPWKYGIPLTILQILMHFFISQSIFLARLVYYDTFGNTTDDGFSTVGYSPSAVLTTFICWTVASVAVLGSGFISMDNRIPTHGNMSAVISALCHADPDGKRTNSNSPIDQRDEGDGLSTKLLMWGVTKEPWRPDAGWEFPGVSSQPEPGHCTFSDQVVELPQNGLPYS